MATETYGEAEAGLVFHPMDQFQVTPLFGGGTVEWFTITNVTLWMGLTVLSIVALLVFGARGRALVPTRSQSVAELAYGLVYKMVEDVTGKDGVVYFPYIMTVFMFILDGQLPRPSSPGLHHHKPHCRDSGSGSGGFHRRDGAGLCEKWVWILEPVLDLIRAAHPAPNSGAD